VLLAALSPSAAAAEPVVTPAGVDGDFADPFVVREGDTFYALATGSGATHLQVARSRDLTTWTELPDALPTLPAWASTQPGFTWAPSVLRRGKTYVLYYTARDTASGFQCISRAVSSRPEGPYVDDSTRPFVCQVAGASSFCGSIDPSPFVDANGRAYLLWKSDENAAQCRAASRVWIQPLTEDGLDVWGAATPLLTADREWEAPLVEGPSMVLRDGVYHLFYSANWYESARYAVGHATCTRPAGPCTKLTVDAPHWKSSATVLGPGGQEFFDDKNGRTWVAYHGWTAPLTSYPSGGARSLRIAPVTFPRGVPTLGTPLR